MRYRHCRFDITEYLRLSWNACDRAYAGMRCQLIIVQAHNPSISFADSRGKQINKDQKWYPQSSRNDAECGCRSNNNRSNSLNAPNQLTDSLSRYILPSPLNNAVL
eukprot:scaffold154048_cov43-Attheya_sp.AAC.1